MASRRLRRRPMEAAGRGGHRAHRDRR
jgi:hypothetical protein